mmetsp:Transcript_2004/g.7165  ORF Transcript_2004/g.7165 Transcript_2004/m.7165 type:complete len:234 (-) Transcript_2004:402-1103(-)
MKDGPWQEPLRVPRPQAFVPWIQLRSGCSSHTRKTTSSPLAASGKDTWVTLALHFDLSTLCWPVALAVRPPAAKPPPLCRPRCEHSGPARAPTLQCAAAPSRALWLWTSLLSSSEFSAMFPLSSSRSMVIGLDALVPRGGFEPALGLGALSAGALPGMVPLPPSSTDTRGTCTSWLCFTTYSVILAGSRLPSPALTTFLLHWSAITEQTLGPPPPKALGTSGTASGLKERSKW